MAMPGQDFEYGAADIPDSPIRSEILLDPFCLCNREYFIILTVNEKHGRLVIAPRQPSIQLGNPPTRQTHVHLRILLRMSKQVAERILRATTESDPGDGVAIRPDLAPQIFQDR